MRGDGEGLGGELGMGVGARVDPREARADAVSASAPSMLASANTAAQVAWACGAPSARCHQARIVAITSPPVARMASVAARMRSSAPSRSERGSRLRSRAAAVMVSRHCSTIAA
ncbi:MAG: hypothetical protein U0359_23890 [Byssovorax sp.]